MAEAMSAADAAASWEHFCEALRQAGRNVLRRDAPDSLLDRAEGWRLLSRFTRLGLQMMLEHGDPDFPVFYAASDETIKVFLPNPDNLYANASIAGDREYRIRGRRGTVAYLSFGTKANRYAVDGTMASTGEIDAADLRIEPDGSFEIALSRQPRPGNWLPMATDSSMVIVRQTFLDRGTETPAQLRIERVGAPPAPLPLSPQALAAGLERAGAFVHGTARLVGDWAQRVAQRPNELDAAPYAADSMRVGGDPKICYVHGYWKLAPDEALVIDSEVPECAYWNFQLANHWLESLDFVHRRVDINKHGARYNADGSVTLVVAAENPGAANFIDTDGHDRGGMLLRWVGAKSHPRPRCRVARLAELKRTRG
ncbi:MAG TPA: DUF1214 domain-containing protein [Nevskia sp.]|nr:DUF1214 domain-containing protein [Nevskia sp.]